MKRIDLNKKIEGSNITVFQMEGDKYITDGNIILNSSQVGFMKNYSFSTFNATSHEKEIKKALSELNEDVNIESDIAEFVTLPDFLKYVKSPTSSLISHIVSVDGRALRFVKEKTEELCKLAISNYPKALRYVPASLQTEEICLLAITQEPSTLTFIKHSSIINKSVKGMVPAYNDPILSIFKRILGLKSESKMVKGTLVPGFVNRQNFLAKVLSLNPMAIKNIPSATLELQKIAIHHNVNALRYIKNPSKDIYLEALKSVNENNVYA